MKYIIFFSEKDLYPIDLDKSKGLQDYEYVHLNCLENLQNFLMEKRPALIVSRDNITISSSLFDNYPKLYNIPWISIINKNNARHWKPLHPKHHYLVNSSSREQLSHKIVSLLIIKTALTEKNVPQTLIPNIRSLKEYIKEIGEQVYWDKGRIIFRENRHSSFIYLINSGLVKTSRMDQLGKELITGIYRKNDLLGLYGFYRNPICPETASSIEASTAYRFPYKDFKELLEYNPRLSLDLAQHLTDTVVRLKSQLLEMAYASVLKKTSNTILQFADDLKQPGLQELKISRTDLASIAGISPESFIRSLSCLKKEGIIAIKGKNINILNSEKLQDIK